MEEDADMVPKDERADDDGDSSNLHACRETGMGLSYFLGWGSQGDEHDDEEGEAMKDGSSADAILRDSWYRLKCLFMESDRNLTVPCCVKIDLIWNGFS